MPTADAIIDKCYHCGDPCDTEKLTVDDKPFCCVGCKTVYEILEGSGLTDYYELENMPGISLNKDTVKGKYDYLRSEAIQHQLHSFQSETKSIINFHIPVIHCSSCIWLLENLNQLVEGIWHTRVNFTKKEVTVTYNPSELKLVDLANFLSKLGYEPLITLSSQSKKEAIKTNHQLYLKIGIAGFCFGNIMLLAFPEYLGLDSVDEELQRFFGYLSAFLSLPVLYAGSEYLISAYKGLRQRYFNIDIPISLGIIALFVRSMYEVLSGVDVGYFDSLAGLIFFLLIGKWFQSKTYQELSFDRDYQSYFPLAVDKMEGVKIVPTQVSLLQPGDEIIIKNNELIPADSTLLSREASIDYSFVTGESMHDHKHEGDYLYAGGRQQGVSVRLKVEKKVSQSYLTQLWNNEAFDKDESEHKLLIDRISKYFTLVIIAIAVAASVSWYWIDSRQVMNVFTSILIVACPCALALSAPFTLGNTMRAMGKIGLYLKNTQVIEVMSNLTNIVFDKTGTITYGSEANVSYLGQVLSPEDEQVIYSMVSHSSHPLSKIIKEFLKECSQIELENFNEITGKGLEARYYEALYKIGSADFVGADKSEQSNSLVYVSKGDIILGKFQIGNKYRNGLKALIDQLSERFKLTVLSGDNESEKEVLEQEFGLTNFVHDQKPDQKLAYIRELKNQGEQTMMIGDGLNDAGALQQSDVGIVIADDVNNFTPASYGILDAKTLSALPSLLKLSRVSIRIIYASFALSFLYNIVGLSFAVLGLLTPIFAAILMPLSSVTVVLFTTLMVNLAVRRLKLNT